MVAGRKRAATARYWSAETASPEARFAARVQRQPNGCWLWNGEPNKYGVFAPYPGDPPIRAHRYAYTILVGPIPEGLHVHHRCHRKGCVNPDHLELIRPEDHTSHHIKALSAAARMMADHGSLALTCALCGAPSGEAKLCPDCEWAETTRAQKERALNGRVEYRLASDAWARIVATSVVPCAYCDLPITPGTWELDHGTDRGLWPAHSDCLG